MKLSGMLWFWRCHSLSSQLDSQTVQKVFFRRLGKETSPGEICWRHIWRTAHTFSTDLLKSNIAVILNTSEAHNKIKRHTQNIRTRNSPILLLNGSNHRTFTILQLLPGYEDEVCQHLCSSVFASASISNTSIVVQESSRNLSNLSTSRSCVTVCPHMAHARIEPGETLIA